MLQKSAETKTNEVKTLEDKLSAEKVKYEGSLKNHNLKVKQHLSANECEEHHKVPTKLTPDTYRFPCMRCGFKARTESILDMHYCEDRTPKHWTNPLNCKICEYEAKNKKDFELHYSCEKCQEDFKDEDHLDQHNLSEQH